MDSDRQLQEQSASGTPPPIERQGDDGASLSPSNPISSSTPPPAVQPELSMDIEVIPRTPPRASSSTRSRSPSTELQVIVEAELPPIAIDDPRDTQRVYATHRPVSFAPNSPPLLYARNEEYDRSVHRPLSRAHTIGAVTPPPLTTLASSSHPPIPAYFPPEQDNDGQLRPAIHRARTTSGRRPHVNRHGSSVFGTGGGNEAAGASVPAAANLRRSIMSPGDRRSYANGVDLSQVPYVQEGNAAQNGNMNGDVLSIMVRLIRSVLCSSLAPTRVLLCRNTDGYCQPYLHRVCRTAVRSLGSYVTA